MGSNTNGTMDKCQVSLLVRCPDYRGVNVHTIIQIRRTVDKFPVYRGVLISEVS